MKFRNVQQLGKSTHVKMQEKTAINVSYYCKTWINITDIS